MSEEQKSPESNEQAEAAADAAQAQGTEAQAEQTAEDLVALLGDARNKADEHLNKLLRLQAELDNTRRRAERDVESAHKYALEKFVAELLPVKDSLELGLAAASGGEEAVARLREGTELTLKMFGTVLEKFGVQEVNPVGAPFNPEHHQAMSMQETAEQAPNTVVAVMQKGYLLNDRLVRPAMVVVAKAPAAPQPSVDEKA